MTQMQLLEELGHGNYGTVKKVLHKPTNVLMAMKVTKIVSTLRDTISLTFSRAFRKSD